MANLNLYKSFYDVVSYDGFMVMNIYIMEA